MRRRTSERGFTLIEVMIVVGIVAILAAIVVPSFFKESRKSKARSETAYMFGELAVREDQYKLERGVYLAATACPTSPPGPTGVTLDSLTCDDTGSPWDLMRVRVGESRLYCSYTITTGTGTGTTNPSGFTWSSPATSWYYIIATCNTDGTTGTESTYFVSSSDSTIQKLNEGQ